MSAKVVLSKANRAVHPHQVLRCFNFAYGADQGKYRYVGRQHYAGEAVRFPSYATTDFLVVNVEGHSTERGKLVLTLSPLKVGLQYNDAAERVYFICGEYYTHDVQIVDEMEPFTSYRRKRPLVSLQPQAATQQ